MEKKKKKKKKTKSQGKRRMMEKEREGDKGPIPAKKKRRRKKKKRIKPSRVTPHLSPTPEKSQSPDQVLLASKMGMRRALHTDIKREGKGRSECKSLRV